MIKNETLAKYLLRVMKGYEENDYNDILHFVELILANQDEVVKLLENNNWNLSNKYNSKTIKIKEIGFAYDELRYDENDDPHHVTVERLHSYIIDGNNNKRIIEKVENFNKIEYNHRSFEEVKEILENVKAECKRALPQSDYVSTSLTKDDLEDYSEKCYKARNIFIPKSVVAFDDDNVVVAEWFFNKNSLWLR